MLNVLTERKANGFNKSWQDSLDCASKPNNWDLSMLQTLDIREDF